MSNQVRRLTAQFQPAHYQLELEPELKSMRLRGTITIRGKKIGRPSRRLTFHQHGLKITAAKIIREDKKGSQEIALARINHHKGFDEVRLHADQLLYGGNYTVSLQFSGHISEGMHGVYPCYYEIDGQRQALIATQFESHYAREAFPCIDEPEAKATFDLTLRSAINETAISNMPVHAQHEDAGKLVTAFETTPKMSTYLLAFVCGDMQSKETTTKNNVAVRVWATGAQPSEGLDFALDVAARCIEFFDEYFGVPYPLAKCDHVALPDFSAGAMENWGLVTYRELALLADPKTASQSSREYVAMVIAHETSHQWFGNLVTMKWWDDLWLNESFANVMEYVAREALFPEWHVWNAFVTEEGLAALRRDAIAGVQAVKTGVNHPDEIASLFDPSIVYAKGGRLLYMLMQYLGEDVFRKGLKTYFDSHAYSNTTGDDLWQALSQASGKDVAVFMKPWLERSGFPLVRVEQSKQKLKLRQSQFLLDPAKADTTRIWPVPLLSSAPTVPALLETPEVSLALNSSEYVRINQGAIGHYIVHYTNPDHLKAIAALAASQKLAIPERLMLLNDSAMLSRSGVQSFAETMRLLENYVGEDNESVWDIMSLVLSDCRRFIDFDFELEGPIKNRTRQLIQTQLARLGWQQLPDESTEDTKLRATVVGLGVYANEPAVQKRALELFELYKTKPEAILAELRCIIFGAAVREQSSQAFAYLLELDESTSNPDLKHDILGALSLTKDTAQAKQLLDRLKDQTKVRQNVIGHWLASLLRNRYTRDQAWHWLRNNWAWIEQIFENDKSYDVFPRYAASAFNTRQLMEEYRTFFTPLLVKPALARNISLGIEELENRVTWLERDLASVQTYLRANT